MNATEYLTAHPEEARYTDSEAVATLGIALDRVEVSIDSESNDHGMLGIDESVPAGPLSIRTRVYVSAGEADRGTIRELVAWATAHCPVCDAAKRAVPVSVEFAESS